MTCCTCMDGGLTTDYQCLLRHKWPNLEACDSYKSVCTQKPVGILGGGSRLCSSSDGAEKFCDGVDQSSEWQLRLKNTLYLRRVFHYLSKPRGKVSSTSAPVGDLGYSCKYV